MEVSVLIYKLVLSFSIFPLVPHFLSSSSSGNFLRKTFFLSYVPSHFLFFNSSFFYGITQLKQQIDVTLSACCYVGLCIPFCFIPIRAFGYSCLVSYLVFVTSWGYVFPHISDSFICSVVTHSQVGLWFIFSRHAVRIYGWGREISRKTQLTSTIILSRNALETEPFHDVLQTLWRN